ncbi:hypothetical protein BD309DRAFT_1072184, partial [Dichomitus squalens]
LSTYPSSPLSDFLDNRSPDPRGASCGDMWKNTGAPIVLNGFNVDARVGGSEAREFVTSDASVRARDAAWRTDGSGFRSMPRGTLSGLHSYQAPKTIYHTDSGSTWKLHTNSHPWYTIQDVVYQVFELPHVDVAYAKIQFAPYIVLGPCLNKLRLLDFM